MKKLPTIPAILLLPLMAYSNQVIDVAVVYSNDHGLSASQKVAWAVDVKQHLDDAYSNFNYVFDVWVSSADLPIATGNQSAPATLAWMQGNPGLQSIRNNTGPKGGADLVLMIGGSTQSSACGRAGVARPPFGTEPPLFVSLEERDHSAFAAIFVQKSGCARWDIIIPHEIGHLMYAEHERDSDNNNVLDKPSSINHGIEVAGVRTIMYGGANSASLQIWSGSTGFSDIYEDNETWLADSAMVNTVAAYRNPAPTAQSCPPVVSTCTGNSVMHVFTPYINEPYQMTNIRLETRQNPSQSWIPRYEGPFTCPTFGASSSFWYRILIDTIYGSTQCGEYYVYINPWNPCDDEEEW